MAIKTHKTFAVTEDFLNSIAACSGSIRRLNELGMLPCVINTDPDENIDLALKLCVAQAYPAPGWTCSRWLPWLADQTGSHDATDAQSSDDLYEERASCGWGENDPTIAAQMLAIIADTLLTAKGK